MRSFKKIFKQKIVLKMGPVSLTSHLHMRANHMHTRMAEMLHAFGLRGCWRCFKVSPSSGFL